MANVIKVSIDHGGGSTSKWSAVARDWNHAAQIWNALKIGPKESPCVSLNGTAIYGDATGAHHQTTGEYLKKAADGFPGLAD